MTKRASISEFARAPAKSRRLSDVVLVRGLPWRIKVTNREHKQTRHLSYSLYCNADNLDPDWFCAAKAKLKILAQKEGKKDHVRTIKHVYYHAKANGYGFKNLFSFERLMKPRHGWYDEQADTIVLAADITADMPHGTKNNMGRITTFPNAKPNEIIIVNNQAVQVNSYVLAFSSNYFEPYFFDNHYAKAENIELDPSTTVEDFKRMVAALPPENRKLDDDCIEAVLFLADRFLMDNVMELAQNFLIHESRKPKLFMYRMAHKYRWNETKEEILQSMQPDDLDLEYSVENAEEYALLDDEAKAALLACYPDLVSDNSNP